LSVDEAKFDKKITLSQKIYKEQIKEHDEVVQVGTGQICHVTTAAAANLLSLKQVDNNLENVKAAGPNDVSYLNDKDLSGGGVVGIGDQIHLSKKKKATWTYNKLVSKTSPPVVVRKSLHKKQSTMAVSDAMDILESQPTIPLKQQSSISPTSNSFSSKPKCAKIKVLLKEVLSKEVEMEKKKHVPIVEKNKKRKFQAQLQCQNLILMMLLMLLGSRTCDNMQNLICQSQNKNNFYLAKQTL